MPSFSGLAIGLSFVFGCLFLGLIGELYYKLWYKKNRGIEENIKSFSHLLCFPTKPISQIIQKNPNFNEPTTDPELGLPKKGFGEEGLDSELIRVHNLCGPPRFLFTINEETKEDLESEDGRSRGGRSTRGKSLGDFLFTVETPNLTPLASPRVYNQNGFNFNPLVGGLTEADVNRGLHSPPSKFKFLRDAEEKLKREKLKREISKREKEGNLSSKVNPLVQSPLSVGSI